MNITPQLVVCDTSVVSIVYNIDPRVSLQAAFYEEYLKGKQAIISFQTIEEIHYGMIKSDWGEPRKNGLLLHLEQYHIIWPNPNLARISAQLRADREKAGRRLSTADAWIAATAIMLDCPLASHDRDFTGIPGLQLIQNPNRIT